LPCECFLLQKRVGGARNRFAVKARNRWNANADNLKAKLQTAFYRLSFAKSIERPDFRSSTLYEYKLPRLASKTHKVGANSLPGAALECNT
jgi:hypothetical protein